MILAAWTALKGAFAGARGIALAVLLALLAAAVAAAWLEHNAGLRLAAEKTRAEDDAARMEKLAGDNAAAAERLAAEAQRAMASVLADRDAERRRAARLQPLTDEISHAPAADDAPLAPVLRRALAGLRGALPAGAGDPPGADRAAGAAPRLRGGAGDPRP